MLDLKLYCCQDTFMDSDFSSLHDVASSVMTLQNIYGVIPKIYCKGECSKVNC